MPGDAGYLPLTISLEWQWFETIPSLQVAPGKHISILSITLSHLGDFEVDLGDFSNVLTYAQKTY